MGQNTGLTIAVILVAIGVLIQAVMMIGLWLVAQNIHEKIETARSDILQRLDPLTQSATEILINSREPLRKITANLEEISKIARERASNVDALVGEIVDKSRLQVVRVDEMVTDLVQKVETTSDAVQRGVLAPVQELSAIFKGMRAGVEFLLARRRTTGVSEATQDEQLFI